MSRVSKLGWSSFIERKTVYGSILEEDSPQRLPVKIRKERNNALGVKSMQLRREIEDRATILAGL